MARVTAPLMSIDASGTYGKALTFSKWKGRNYVRERVTPANPKSAKQVGVRSMFKFLAQAWADLGDVAKASWEATAAARSMSPFDVYCGTNMTRWQNNDGPTQATPAAEASAALTITTQTLTGGNGMVTVSIVPSAATSIWGFVIFRDAAAITTPTWANAIAVIPADGATQVDYVDSPLAAGTYHYRVAAVNVDGKFGTVKADGTAVVT